MRTGRLSQLNQHWPTKRSGKETQHLKRRIIKLKVSSSKIKDRTDGMAKIHINMAIPNKWN
jgi:hypothetical protein